jgi:GNAT superfamily N-acetyltransferase
MTLTVRPTSAADTDDVSRILRLSYGQLLAPDYPPDVLDAIVPLISRAKPELVASGTYYAACTKLKMVAVGGWTHEAPGTQARAPGLGHIRHVATDPAHLRMGAARVIIARCFVEARAAGLTKMACLSTRTAVPFYQSCGFVVRGQCDVMIAGHAFPSVEMHLTL